MGTNKLVRPGARLDVQTGKYIPHDSGAEYMERIADLFVLPATYRSEVLGNDDNVRAAYAAALATDLPAAMDLLEAEGLVTRAGSLMVHVPQDFGVDRRVHLFEADLSQEEREGLARQRAQEWQRWLAFAPPPGSSGAHEDLVVLRDAGVDLEEAREVLLRSFGGEL